MRRLLWFVAVIGLVGATAWLFTRPEPVALPEPSALPSPIPPPPTTWARPADTEISREGAWVQDTNAAWPTWYRVQDSHLEQDGNGWLLEVNWESHQQDANGRVFVELPLGVAVDVDASPYPALRPLATSGAAAHRVARFLLPPPFKPALGQLLWGPIERARGSWGVELAPRCGAGPTEQPPVPPAEATQLSVLRRSSTGCELLRWSGGLHPAGRWEGDCSVHLAVHPGGLGAIASGFTVPWALRPLRVGGAALLPLPPGPRGSPASPAPANVAAWDAAGGLRAATYIRGGDVRWLTGRASGWGEVMGAEPAPPECFAPASPLACRLWHRGSSGGYPLGPTADECATPAPSPVEPAALEALNQRFPERRPGLRWQQIGGVLAYLDGTPRGALQPRFAAPAWVWHNGQLHPIADRMWEGSLQFVVRGEHALFTEQLAAGGRQYRLVRLPDNHEVTLLSDAAIQGAQFWPTGLRGELTSGLLVVSRGSGRSGRGGSGHKHIRRTHRQERR